MHVIDSLEFDVGLADEVLAFDLQGPLQAFLRGPAVRIIDEVFEQLSAPDEVLRLGQLTIDLGRVSTVDPVAQWQARLRERLHAELQGLRWRSTPAHPDRLADARLLHRGTAELETLLHYLQHGTLGWRAVLPARQGLAAWAGAVIGRDPGAVARWLRQAEPRDVVLQRLTLQMPDSAIAVLADRLGAVPPGSAGTPPTWRARVEAVAQAALHAGPGAQLPALRRRLWRVLLGELLAATAAPLAWRPIRVALLREAGLGDDRGDLSPPRPLSPAGAGATPTAAMAELPSSLRRQRARLEQALRAAFDESFEPPAVAGDQSFGGGDRGGLDAAIGDALRRDAAWLRSSLQRVVPHPGRRMQVHRRLRAALRPATLRAVLALLAPTARAQRHPLWPQPGSAGGQRQLPGEIQDLAALAQARGRVDAALGEGRPPAWHADWVLLRDHDPGWLRLSLRRHGRDESPRRRLAEQFDDAAVADVIDLLAPGEREFVGNLMRQAPLWLAASDGPRPLAPALRQFTMAFLLADRGTVFNRRSYLGALLRQLARQQGRSERELMREMSAALASSGAPLGLRGQMLVLLAELGGDSAAAAAAAGNGAAPAGARSSPPDAGRAPVGSSAAASLWRALQRADDAALPEAVQALCRDGPSRRRLAGGGLSPSRLLALATRLEPAQAGLLRQWFGAAESAGAPGQGDVVPIGRDAVLRAVAWDLWFATWVATRQRGFDRRAFVEGLARHRQRRVAAGFAGTAGDAMALLHGLLRREVDAAAAMRGATTAGDLPAWRRLLERHGAALRRPLQAALADADFADRLCRVVPEAAWQHLLALLRPRLVAPLLHALDVVDRAASLASGTTAARHLRRQVWRFIFALLFEQGWRYRSDDFARRLADFIAGMSRPALAPAPPPENDSRPEAGHLALARALLDLGRRSRDPVAVALAQAMAAAPQPRSVPAPAPTPTPAPARPATTAHRGRAMASAVDAGEPVYLANAGLVLLAGYLPRLFSTLALTDGAAFVGAAASERAVHLLQWLVDGRGQADEPALVLNKLLCGLDLDMPVAREGPLTAHEQDTALQLLQAVIAHWRALGSTSVAGLRESFLQREGRLAREDAHWRLLVEPRAFDMLLDRLPWGFATVKLPWMREVLHVDWR